MFFIEIFILLYKPLLWNILSKYTDLYIMFNVKI